MLYEGQFNACGHTVEFWYRWDGRRVKPVLSQLYAEAESRAREMLAEDFTSGELNATEHEIGGAWYISN